jgi:hypothetical protein
VTFKVTSNAQSLKIEAAAPELVSSCGEEFLYWDQDPTDDEGYATARASHLISQMTTAFDDALVENWEPHDGTFNLPDPNDEHVVTAALVGGAGAIVTDNLKDFPIAKIPAHIKVLSPSAFAADTVSVSPDVALQAVETMASQVLRPTIDD